MNIKFLSFIGFISFHISAHAAMAANCVVPNNMGFLNFMQGVWETPMEIHESLSNSDNPNAQDSALLTTRHDLPGLPQVNMLECKSEKAQQLREENKNEDITVTMKAYFEIKGLVLHYVLFNSYRGASEKEQFLTCKEEFEALLIFNEEKCTIQVFGEPEESMVTILNEKQIILK